MSFSRDRQTTVIPNIPAPTTEQSSNSRETSAQTHTSIISRRAQRALTPGKYECIGQGRSAWCTKAELSDPADSDTPRRLLMGPMYYIGLDVHNQKISYCVKEGGGKVFAEGWLPATRYDLD